MFRAVLGIPLLLLASNLVGQQFNTDQLSVSDGLSQSQVYTLLEDHRGYIWMGTQGGGLCAFDGFDFDCLAVKDGLPDGFVNCMLLAPDNRLLIGTRKGLVSYNGSLFSVLPSDAERAVTCLATSPSGEIWVGTNSGLYQLIGSTWALVGFDKITENHVIEDIVWDHEGRPWVATTQGVFHEREDGWISLNDGLRTEMVNCLEVMQNGEVYAGLYGGGLVHFGEGEWYPVLPNSRAVVLCLEEDSEGDLWAGTLNEGLWIREAGSSTWKNITEDQGLPANHVRALLEDSWGNIWIGTSGAGVARYRGQTFEHVARDRGLPGKQVYSMEEIDPSHWLLGVADQGLWHYHPEAADRFVQDSLITSGKVKALARDERGWLWAGTEGQGLYVMLPDSTIHLRNGQGLLNDFITDIEPRKDGMVWVGTAGGGLHLVQPFGTWDGRTDITFRAFTRAQGMPDDRITDVEVDALGRTWFATRSNGMGVLLDGEIITFNREHGLPSNAVKSLEIDARNRLWIGTQDAGLCSIDLTADLLSMELAGFNQQLVSKNTYSLLADDTYLWLGSEKGMSRLTLNEDGELMDLVHYGPDDGFLGIETTSNAAALGSDGRLWFGTIDGLNITSPNARSRNELPPRLSIAEMRLFYTPLADTHLRSFLGDWNSVSDSLRLTYEQNSVGFDFKGINQARPNGVSYRWRLLGHENEWSPASSQQSISYSNLSPGNYTFEVEAVNEDGVWTPVPERVRFEILRPFWQELWFKVVIGAGILLLLGLVIWLRVRQIKAKARERNDRLSLENSILELEQKALRLQMNPHFIFNTLNSIQGLIARKDEKTARLYLSKFSRLMRLNLENSREELITLDQELEALRYFLELERFTHEEKFEYTIECGVDEEEWMVPPLVIQPFAENAIIHGLLPKDGPGKLTIRCRERLGALEIEIADNGIGRKAAAARNKNRQAHRSTGLQVTRERLELLQQNGVRKDAVVFRDLVGQDGEALGTSVLVIVYQEVFGSE